MDIYDEPKYKTYNLEDIFDETKKPALKRTRKTKPRSGHKYISIQRTMVPQKWLLKISLGKVEHTRYFALDMFEPNKVPQAAIDERNMVLKVAGVEIPD